MELNELNQQIITEFRANAGVLSGQFAGSPLLLLSTTGARTGQPRVNPLAYFGDGDRLLIVASFAGADKSPPWFHNLVQNDTVGVEVGAESYRASAAVLTEPERSEAYARIASAMPVFADYQSKTTRVIPVIALSRA